MKVSSGHWDEEEEDVVVVSVSVCVLHGTSNSMGAEEANWKRTRTARGRVWSVSLTAHEDFQSVPSRKETSIEVTSGSSAFSGSCARVVARRSRLVVRTSRPALR